MIKVLIVDDHAIVREGLKRILSEVPDIEVKGEAADGHEAIEKLKKVWDVILLDIGLPGKNGIEVLKQIKKDQPESSVLMLSMYDEGQYAMRALKAGASGYLTKSSLSNQLVDAVRKVADGGKYITSTLAEKLANNLGPMANKAPHERLTDREYQVFTMLSSGKTVSNIAKELSLSVKTVSTHRSHILEKMELKNNAELIRYSIERE